MRILVAADRPLVAGGVLAVVRNAHPGWPVRQVRGAQDCLRAADSWDPDVVVVSVDLPSSARAGLCRDLRGRGVHTICLVQSAADAIAALDHGSAAVVTEEDGLSGVLASVERAATGWSYVSPPVLGAVLRELADRAANRPSGTVGQGVTRLSARERVVLELLRAGYGRAQIAGELGIAPQTAKTHIRHVLQKLGVHSRREAAAIAEKAGIPHPRSGSLDSDTTSV